jgi:hypothetical protein
MGEWRYISAHSLTSALDGGEWSASRPGCFTPKEGSPPTHWIGGLRYKERRKEIWKHQGRDDVKERRMRWKDDHE